MTSRAIKTAANEFRVWRAGTSVNWDCTLRDISEETGLSQSIVSRIIAKKGWKFVDEDGRHASHFKVAVDTYCRATNTGFRGRT